MIGLALLAVWMVGALFWTLLRSYRVSDPARAERIYEEAGARREQRDKLAMDRARNGWWIIERELATQAPLFTRLEEHAAGPRTPLLRKLIEQLDAVVPALREAVGKPVLAWPPLDWSQVGVPRVKMTDYRAMLLSLHADARYHECREEATEAALVAYAIASRLNGQGPLITGMTTLMGERIALSAINLLLLRSDLEPECCESVLNSVKGADPEDLLAVCDEEFAWQMDMFGWCARTRDFSIFSPYDKLCHFPGYLERERKVAQELYLIARPALERAEPDPGLPQRRKIRIPAFSCSGEGGWNNVIQQYRLSWSRREGVRALAALQLYRARKGRYPDSLTELTPWPLNQPPRDWLARDGRFHYESKGERILLRGNDPELAFCPAGMPP